MIYVRPDSVPASLVRSIVVSLAMKLQGVPYIWGGDSPQSGFDCSGFVVWILQAVGLLKSHTDMTAHDLYEAFPFQKEDTSPQPGDLVYYGSLLDRITHVGIFIGHGNVILCSGGNQTTTTIEEARKKNAMVKIKPLQYRSDYVGSGRLL